MRKLAGYHEHRAVSFCFSEDLKMPASISITKVEFLNECHDLAALIDHTERLLCSGRQIPPLAAALHVHSSGLQAAKSNNGDKRPCQNM